MTDECSREALRVAMVLPSMRRAGAESVVATLCQSLVKVGAEVHLVVIGNRFDYGEALHDSGVQVHFLDLYRGPIRFYRRDLHWHIRQQMRAFFQRLKPAVVHFQLSHALVWGGSAARAAGAQVFYTAHGLDPWLRARDLVSRWRHWEFAQAVRQSACHLLAVSAPVAHHLALGLRLATAVVVQPNPLELELWHPQHPKETPSNQPRRVMMVGTLYPLKRVHVGLLAMQTLRSLASSAFMPSCELWIVGDGPERSRLETMTKQLGLEKWVSFLGVRHDIPALLSQADVVWLLSEREGMPMAALEAMAAGIPLVATDVPGTRELVQHEVNGLLVPLDHPDAVARTTQRLWNEETLHKNIVSGGTRTAQLCDAMTIANQHLLYYQQACHA